MRTKSILARFLSVLVGVGVALALGGAAQADSLTWNVAGDGNWDTSTSNWDPGPQTFTDDGVDAVTFNNTAGGTITISPNMSPLSTTVSAASGTYTFSGGPIDSGSLTKSAGGTLVLASDNTYSGKTTVNAPGTLEVRTAGGLGSNTEDDAVFLPWNGAVGPTLRLINSSSTDFQKNVRYGTQATIHVGGGGGGTTHTLPRVSVTSSDNLVTITGDSGYGLNVGTCGWDSGAQNHFGWNNQLTGGGILTIGSVYGTTAAPGSGDTMHFTGPGTTIITGNVDNLPTGRQMKLDGTASDCEIRGDIGRNGGLFKWGTGTWTLKGKMDYPTEPWPGAGSDILVADGALILADNAQFRFNIPATSGGNLKIVPIPGWGNPAARASRPRDAGNVSAPCPRPNRGRGAVSFFWRQARCPATPEDESSSSSSSKTLKNSKTTTTDEDDYDRRWGVADFTGVKDSVTWNGVWP